MTHFFIVSKIFYGCYPSTYLMSNSALIHSISIVGQILKMKINVCLGKNGGGNYLRMYIFCFVTLTQNLGVSMSNTKGKVFGKIVIYYGCELNKSI